VREAGYGPLRRFAAMQRRVCSRGTAAKNWSPETFSVRAEPQSYQTSKQLTVPRRQRRPRILVGAAGYLRSIGFLCNIETTVERTIATCGSIRGGLDADRLGSSELGKCWPAVGIRIFCGGLRFCTTPHRRLCPQFRRVIRLPFDSGPVAQSRDRRDVPNASLRTARKTATFLAR
jgi:hypothetical protein